MKIKTVLTLIHRCNFSSSVFESVPSNYNLRVVVTSFLEKAIFEIMNTVIFYDFVYVCLPRGRYIVERWVRGRGAENGRLFCPQVLRSPHIFIYLFFFFLKKCFSRGGFNIGCLFHFRLQFEDRLQKSFEFVLKFIDRRVKEKIWF